MQTTIIKLFDELKTKDIYCLGYGKHFKNITLSFLKDSGLIENLRGFVDSSEDQITMNDMSYGVHISEEGQEVFAQKLLETIGMIGGVHET